MFDFLKKKKKQIPDSEQPTASTEIKNSIEPENLKPPEQDTKGFFSRLKQSLSKTRAKFTVSLGNLFLGKKALDQSLLDEIELILLTADLGVLTTAHLIDRIKEKLSRKELKDSDAVFQLLKEEMILLLKPSEQPLELSAAQKPFVILVIGINGSGKTTTIGKLTHYYQEKNKKILLAAGDTFRAAAIEQLLIWGERNHVPVVSQQPGADTAAVIYDALASAQAKHVDLLIADTAGRLHTQSHLMAELQKIRRVLQKLDPLAPHETLIILDASIGQNALNQVLEFKQAMHVTGIALTKLDGTAKGGIIFAIAKQTGLPIRFIGFGENINDLKPFNAEEFVNALFD